MMSEIGPGLPKKKFDTEEIVQNIAKYLKYNKRLGYCLTNAFKLSSLSSKYFPILKIFPG